MKGIIALLAVAIIAGVTAMFWLRDRSPEGSSGSSIVPSVSVIPHKTCPNFLQSYSSEVNTEQEAQALLAKWMSSEYSSEEIDRVEIERTFQENNAFYIGLSDALPQTDEHIGYRYYKIDNGQVFGLFCGK